jgi:PLD-like domain
MQNNAMLNGLYDFLKKHYPHVEGTYFSKPAIHHFGGLADNLFSTPPPDKWSTDPNKPLPDAHSKKFVDTVEELITNAKSRVDITNLRLPSGAFASAIINGIKNNKSPSPITIRILCGKGGTHTLGSKEFLEMVKANLNGKRVNIYVGVQVVMRFLEPIGWNHAKYVAVDGTTILFGGHNYIENTYLGENPIYDLSMKLQGPAAGKAHLFSNELWKYVNKHSTFTYSDSLINDVIGKEKVPADWSDANIDPIPVGNVPAMHITQPGHDLLADMDFSNPSASSIYYAMQNAQRTICISQQDIGGMGGKQNDSTEEGLIRNTTAHVPYVSIRDMSNMMDAYMYYFDINLLHSITTSLHSKKNLQVQIVLSNQGALSEADKHNGYSNGVSASCVFRALGWYMQKKLKMSTDAIASILANQVQIKTIAFAKETKWRVGRGYTIGNHAKYWSVDDEICSIGSNNFYPSTIVLDILGHRTGHHQEWAVILGNTSAYPIVQQIRENYFDKIFSVGAVQPFKVNYIWGMRDPR